MSQEEIANTIFDDLTEIFSEAGDNEAVADVPTVNKSDNILGEARLGVDLVPRSCWFVNIRDHITGSKWNDLKKKAFRQSGYACEICGEKGDNHPVECHEIWHFDDEAKTQTLLGLIALCPSCHEVKHLGPAELKGKSVAIKQHMMEINGWSDQTPLCQ